MANYWSEFSIAFSLPSQEAQDYALKLHSELFDDRAKADDLFGEDFNCSFNCAPDGSDTPGLWISQADGESSGVDSAIEFIQHILKKFVPPDQQDKWAVAMEWSNSCSKPRLDAFGGGAAIITAKEVTSMSTCDWVRQQLESLNKPS